MSEVDALALSPQMQRWVVDVARFELARAMHRAEREPGPPPDPRTAAKVVRGFVSWHLNGQLQGCIGLVESEMPLEDFVRRFAVQAGLHDARTPALRVADLPHLDFELHLLSAQRAMVDGEGQRLRGLDALASALQPEHDGLWLTHPSGARAFFLPSVWAQLPRPRDFVDALARKAGLDPQSREAHACEGAVVRAWTLHDRSERA